MFVISVYLLYTQCLQSTVNSCVLLIVHLKIMKNLLYEYIKHDSSHIQLHVLSSNKNKFGDKKKELAAFVKFEINI